MGRYANSGGKNLGKKYKILKGDEVATPQSTKKARAFILWYGRNFENLRRRINNWDDEIATDTALKIYEAIELKDLRIDSYKYYYFRAYHTNALKSKRDEMVLNVNFTRLSDSPNAGEFRAPDPPENAQPEDLEILEGVILDYVLTAYPPFESSIFEIFVGLQPNISCRGLSIMLGLRSAQVYEIITKIRRDVAERFKGEKDNLLSFAK